MLYHLSYSREPFADSRQPPAEFPASLKGNSAARGWPATLEV